MRSARTVPVRSSLPPSSLPPAVGLALSRAHAILQRHTEGQDTPEATPRDAHPQLRSGPARSPPDRRARRARPRPARQPAAPVDALRQDELPLQGRPTDPARPLRVGDQIIPQAADQERPLGDDVRAADGTTFAVNYRPARRSLDAAVHKTATSRCCRGGLRPPCRRPRWSPPGVTRDRRTFGGCPATTELIQPPGRGPAE